MFLCKKTMISLLVVLSVFSVFGADKQSGKDPEGKWLTFDEDTGKPKSVIALSIEKGQLIGKVVKLHDEDPDSICTECSGKRKNKKIIGMKIIWGLTEEKEGKWTGGKVLDPENGKEYSCKIQVIEKGKKLKVRGYMGISLLGRTQTWKRVQK
ncbi:MAG: DUF2147 domain-containing protein [bacterium]